MADEQTIVSEVGNTSEALSNKLQDMVFGASEQAQQNEDATQTIVETKLEVKQPEAAVEVKTEEAKPNWFKDKWGWEDENVAEQEIKTLKEKAEKSFEYKNEESKKIAEYINEGEEGWEKLYQHFDTQFKVKKLSKADLSDKNAAAEIVKFGILRDNADANLSAEEVEFLFHEKYAIPEKPVQGDLEEDADYQARVNSWQNNINNIEKRLIIEAKMQQPKLAQLKTELVLPQIQKNSQSQNQQPTQEELAAFEKTRDNFLQSATKSINDFNGFSVQVKDKDVDYTVGYSPSQEEKAFINSKIQKFAQSGFNANEIFKEDWVTPDGTLKVDKMTEDLSRIYFGKNAESKLAFDSGNKRLEAYLKEKKQIDIAPVVQGTFMPNKGAETISDKLREAVFG